MGWFSKKKTTNTTQDNRIVNTISNDYDNSVDNDYDYSQDIDNDYDYSQDNDIDNDYDYSQDNDIDNDYDYSQVNDYDYSSRSDIDNDYDYSSEYDSENDGYFAGNTGSVNITDGGAFGLAEKALDSFVELGREREQSTTQQLQTLERGVVTLKDTNSGSIKWVIGGIAAIFVSLSLSRFT